LQAVVAGVCFCPASVLGRAAPARRLPPPTAPASPPPARPARPAQVASDISQRSDVVVRSLPSSAGSAATEQLRAADALSQQIRSQYDAVQAAYRAELPAPAPVEPRQRRPAASAAPGGAPAKAAATPAATPASAAAPAAAVARPASAPVAPPAEVAQG
jgi:hypothetical protein